MNCAFQWYSVNNNTYEARTPEESRTQFYSAENIVEMQDTVIVKAQKLFGPVWKTAQVKL